MQSDAIIVGQGVSGTFLSYFLAKEGCNVTVIDDYAPNSPSRIAAGIINPVTGRRMVTVWLAEEILPFAAKAYHEIGQHLAIDTISTKSIIDFFPNPFMRESFLKRMEQQVDYVHAYPEQNKFNKYFNYEFGCGEIRPSYIAHLERLLPSWRTHLEEKGALLPELFDMSHLVIENNKVRYKDVSADTIIFCDGNHGASNHFFKNLPFALNKGEALIVHIPDLHDAHIYKKSMTLAPMAAPGIFWLGSSYEWDYTNAHPTESFREKALTVLRDWIKTPFKIVDHMAGLRPATVERRPFVGMHPNHPQVGILNGMGTKGCSLGPYFAHQLAQHILHGTAVTAEASVQRFAKVLNR